MSAAIAARAAAASPGSAGSAGGSSTASSNAESRDLGIVELLFAAAVLVALAAGVITAPHVALQQPLLSAWAELTTAFAVGCAQNVALAGLLCAHGFTSEGKIPSGIPWDVSMVCGVLLAVPYTVPYRLGISASTHALVGFIGVWKAIDVMMGTRPPAVVGNGHLPLVIFLLSPVEYCTDERSSRILSASPGRLTQELMDVLGCFLSLALTASVSSLLLLERPLGLPPQMIAPLALYAEVWTIYLFLHFMTGTFSTLLAVAGFQPQVMFNRPLLRGTSISDFWSRRWNMLIHGLFKRTVFRPLLRRGLPSWVAGLTAFAISGAFHEYAFALQQPDLRSSVGRCFCFFVVQAPIVSLEKALRKQIPLPRLLNQSGFACTICWTILLVPFAPLFMHSLKTSGVFEQIYTLVPYIKFV